jgi:hypothetical protein
VSHITTRRGNGANALVDLVDMLLQQGSSNPKYRGTSRMLFLSEGCKPPALLVVGQVFLMGFKKIQKIRPGCF